MVVQQCGGEKEEVKRKWTSVDERMVLENCDRGSLLTVVMVMIGSGVERAVQCDMGHED